MQARLILQESTWAYRHSSTELLLEWKLCAGVLYGTTGICLYVPTCWQDLPFYHNAYIRPGQK